MNSVLPLVFFLTVGAVLHAQTGFVKSAGQTIPGVSVTASQGETKITAITDQNGCY